MTAHIGRDPIGARVTVVLCALASLLEGFDNQSMGVAAPKLALEFALSPEQKGLVFSAATLGLFIGAAFGGRVSDILGRRRMLAASLLLFGLCSFLTAMAMGPPSLIVARLLTGLGLGGAMPTFIALSSESVPPQRRVSAVTIIMAGMPLGGAVAGLIAVGDQFGWGWRTIFYVGGAAPILLSWLVLRGLPPEPLGNGRNKSRRHRLRTAKPQVANGRVGEALDVPDALAHLIEDRDPAFEQRLSVHGGPDAPRAAIEESHAERMFQFGNRLRHNRVRDRELFSCFRDAARLRHSHQHMKVSQPDAAANAICPLHLLLRSEKATGLSRNRTT